MTIPGYLPPGYAVVGQISAGADVSASGVELDVAVSFIAGVAGSVVEGVTFPVNVTLIDGLAQGNANASGELLEIAVTADYGDAFVAVSKQGFLISVGWSQPDGVTTANPVNNGSSELLINCVFNEGEARGDGSRGGVSYSVAWSLIAGVATANSNPTVAGKTLTTNVQFIPGSGRPGDVALSGFTLTVPVTLIDGMIGADAHADGAPQPETLVNVVLNVGEATGDATTETADLDVIVSLIPGAVSNGAGVTVPGQELPVVVSLLEGTAGIDADVLGDLLIVGIEFAEVGTATGEHNQEPSRAGGPIFGPSRGVEHRNVRVPGVRINVAAGIIQGIARGEAPFIPTELPLLPILDPAPPLSAEIEGAIYEGITSLVAGAANVSVEIAGTELEHIDWVGRDNAAAMAWVLEDA